MSSSWFLIDTWLSNRPGDDSDHVLFREIDEEYLSTIKGLIAKVGDGRHDWGGCDDPDWRMLRLVYLTPVGVSVLLEVFGARDFDVRVDPGFTVCEIDKIRRVIACSHCVGDEFWAHQLHPGIYTECDHWSIGI